MAAGLQPMTPKAGLFLLAQGRATHSRLIQWNAASISVQQGEQQVQYKHMPPVSWIYCLMVWYKEKESQEHLEHSFHWAVLRLRAAKSICCFETGHQEAGVPAIVWITRPPSQSWGSWLTFLTLDKSDIWKLWAKLLHNQTCSFHPLPRPTQTENTCVLVTPGSNYRPIWAQKQEERKCEADGQVIGHLKVFNELNVSYKQESNAEKYFCPLLLLCHQTPTWWCSDVKVLCWKQNPYHKVRYVPRKTRQTQFESRFLHSS